MFSSHRFPRSRRIADLLKEEIGDMLMGELKDPRVQGLVTVMEVKVSKDLRYADVFVSILGNDKERTSAMEGINKAGGFIRSSLGRRLNLKRIPELRFHLDLSLDKQEHIEKLLQETARRDAGKRR